MTDDLDRELREAWPTMDPPAGFADRVMRARRTGRQRWPIAAGLALLAAAALVLVLWPRTVEGALEASVRTSVALGSRAVAVAEAGANLNWQISREAHVTQRTGSVFYRVERGGPFVVETPAGRVEVKGTCFRVEVLPMSKEKWVGAGMGAAAAVLSMVTVYEGKVLLANERGAVEVTPGLAATMRSQGAPTLAANATAQASQGDTSATPAGELSREQLVARDAQQRQIIENLKRQLAAEQSQVAAAVHKDDKEGKTPFYAPSKDELLQMAKDCQVKWDEPSMNKIGPDRAAELGLSPAEVDAFNRVNQEFASHYLPQLTALYTQVVGEAPPTQVPHVIESLFGERADKDEMQRVFAKLARERAGLQPVDDRGGGPVEQFMRLVSTVGDRYERELGQAIGPDLAHSIRSKQGGWGSRSAHSYGCPKNQ